MSLMDASLEPGYDLIVQEPWCCVPACVKMMLQRRGFSSGSQEEIGIELGLVVPPDQVSHFTLIGTGLEPPGGYGTRINEPEFALDTYFRRHGLQLKCDYVPGSAVDDLEAFIADHLGAGDDILTCFRYRHLYGVEAAGDCGHASLIQGMEERTLTLADPRGPLYQSVDRDTFFASVLAHRKGDLELGGFWVVSSKGD